MFYWDADPCNVVLRYKFQPNAEIVVVVSNKIWQGIIKHGEDFPYCKTMSAVSTNAYIIFVIPFNPSQFLSPSWSYVTEKYRSRDKSLNAITRQFLDNSFDYLSIYIKIIIFSYIMIIDKSTEYRDILQYIQYTIYIQYILQDVVRHFDIYWDNPWPLNMLTH